jgi:hypothetical protein
VTATPCAGGGPARRCPARRRRAHRDRGARDARRSHHRAGLGDVGAAVGRRPCAGRSGRYPPGGTSRGAPHHPRGSREWPQHRPRDHRRPLPACRCHRRGDGPASSLVEEDGTDRADGC